MDIKELDKMAKNGEPMPLPMPAYEQAYYQASRYLYLQFLDGKLSIEQCRKEKQEIIESYNLGKAQWNLFMALPSIEEKLKQLKQQGFNTVLEWEVLEEISKLLDAK